MLTAEEREWIIAGLAWVGLQRWMCGAAAGEAARLWFEGQMDRRLGLNRPGRYITPGMQRLEADYCRQAHGLVRPASIPDRLPPGVSV